MKLSRNVNRTASECSDCAPWKQESKRMEKQGGAGIPGCQIRIDYALIESALLMVASAWRSVSMTASKFGGDDRNMGSMAA